MRRGRQQHTNGGAGGVRPSTRARLWAAIWHSATGGRWVPYAAAILVTAAALALTDLLHAVLAPGGNLLLLAAVIVSAWYGGLVPGLLASALAIVGARFLILPARGDIFALAGSYFRIAVFVGVSFLTSALSESLRSARRRAEGAATAAREAEREVTAMSHMLEQNIKELAAIFNHAPTGLAISQDPECNDIRLNPVLAELLATPRDQNASYSRPDRGTLGYEVYIEGRSAAAEELPMQRAAATHAPVEQAEFEIRHRRDGRVVFLRGAAVPVFDKRGGVQRVIGAFLDTTQERALRADAERARAEAERANRAKSVYLASMSHELRTPLHTIAGYTELLTEGIHGPLTAAQQRDLERIRRSQQHLLGLITGVLDVAKIEIGRVELALEDVPVAALLSALGEMIAPQLAAKQLEYELQARDPATLAVHADPEKLRQIVLNLLSNAIKFTPPGGTVALMCESDREGVAIRVRDTGSGIPADRLEAIFEPFVRVTRGTAQRVEGTGLGLAISRELARAMDGDLTVVSTPGTGSVFTLTLPRARGGTA